MALISDVTPVAFAPNLANISVGGVVDLTPGKVDPKRIENLSRFTGAQLLQLRETGSGLDPIGNARRLREVNGAVLEACRT